ncbi:MAG: LicD family protein [Chlamydiae bacterium]|nr:LicD family protein [Chlamydiota bacterium]
MSWFSPLAEKIGAFITKLAIKIGMPLVCLYHTICINPFLNICAQDAQGIEKWANQALIPIHYLFEGKLAVPSEKETYLFSQRFNYTHHFFIKTSLSITALPVSLVSGGILKGISFLFPETRKRHSAIVRSLKKTEVQSNLPFYKKIGMDIQDFDQAESIEKPKHKREKIPSKILKKDIEAFHEIVTILKKHKIPFWIDCGTCLGAYRYGGVIPWDWDIDIAVLEPDYENVKNALNELDSNKYAVQDWSSRELPNTYLKVFVKKTGTLIDFYHFKIDSEKKEVSTIFSNESNIFITKNWKISEKRYTAPMPFDRVFPFKKALFEGIEVPVPGKIVEYLQTFYGKNLEPAYIFNELTQSYEKDLSHPYWKIPAAR